jgi:hypothetical protein
VAPAKPKVARATEVGEDSRVGRMPLGPARRENKKKEMGRMDDWVEIVLGCAEKKKRKKVFGF